MSISKYQRDKLLHIIEKLISWDICAPFRELVDPIRDGATDYFDVIKEPMSLNEVKKKLVNNQYTDLKGITYDVNLIWNNARLYNHEDSIFALMAKEAQNYFNEKMKTFPSTPEEEWLRKIRRVANQFYEAITHPPPDIDPKGAKKPISIPSLP